MPAPDRARPELLTWLSRAWLIEAALLWRAGTATWDMLKGAGGPGSGGVIFLLPLIPMFWAFALITGLTSYGLARASMIGMNRSETHERTVSRIMRSSSV